MWCRCFAPDHVPRVIFAAHKLMIMQDGEAYAYLLNVLAPEHGTTSIMDTKDPSERANLILEHAERMECKRYITPKDIVEGSSNLNLAFVAHIFHQRFHLLSLTHNTHTPPQLLLKLVI